MIKLPLKIPILGKLALNKSTVVVEIGNDWLKLLENKTSLSEKSSVKVSCVKLVQIEESVSLAVSKIFKNLDINTQSVITYIPRHLVTARILEFPSLDPQEISDIVNLQVAKQTPYSKEEIVSAHKIIGSEREGYAKVILAIARRNLINERIEVLEKAGLKVEKVLLSSEGVYSWFKMAYANELKLESQAIGIMDVDSNYSDFIVIRKGALVFTRNILIGANQLLIEPAKWQDTFIEELKRSIELYQNEEKGTKVIKIFLSGASANIKYLDRAINTKLDIFTEITDPLKNLHAANELSVLREEKFKFISFSPLIGIAMGREELKLDLTPAELRIQKQMENKRKQLTLTGVLFTSIIMLASLLLLINIYNKNTYLAQLKKRIAEVGGEAGDIEKMRTRIDLVKGRLDAKGASLNMLSKICELTPKEIHFTSIDIEERKQVILKGRALAMSDVFKFVTSLENSSYFENVKATHTTTKKDKDAEYTEFDIVCVYESLGK
ncbi:MAG: hypothetical protein COS99_00120 [Candidatus Omnitrophica bacterium CG07_land_8_20_14_0_80_42_15]|uniref:SHS2 domain-containing protein n=1 Tax=Candidatus Aquitaenariimonas noxiae TaxID=1974741 RepID=A0A2J0KVF2_9BACT|nr:MAG: hypothetical protein COS99_00120 [Candidatus Omnitrophica bacterium CG07_land_8_20_14_0_80_42_15]